MFLLWPHQACQQVYHVGRNKMNVVYLLLLLIGVFSLSACGQKGPLYAPEQTVHHHAGGTGRDH